MYRLLAVEVLAILADDGLQMREKLSLLPDTIEVFADPAPDHRLLHDAHVVVVSHVAHDAAATRYQLQVELLARSRQLS